MGKGTTNDKALPKVAPTKKKEESHSPPLNPTSEDQ
jgi:hypothetical protein